MLDRRELATSVSRRVNTSEKFLELLRSQAHYVDLKSFSPDVDTPSPRNLHRQNPKPAVEGTFSTLKQS